MNPHNNQKNNGQEEIFRFGNEVIQDGLERAERSVLIRIFWDQPRSRMFVQNSLNQLWHYDGSIQVIEVGFGLLQVVFPSIDAVNWVLDRRPWSVNMNVMNMVPFSPPSVEIFKELQFMAVWIKLSRVPSHCVTTRFGRKFFQFFDFSTRASRPFFYRCGFLGHASLRCPHTDIPLDHEARGPWMSIGRVGFRIMESSLQKYIQNQIKAKRSEPGNSDFGEFSFVTKEKRFGYSVQPLVDEAGLEDNEVETGSFAASSKQPGLPIAHRQLPKDGAKPPNGRGSQSSDGALARMKQAAQPLASAPVNLINKDKVGKVKVMKGSTSLYIHPGRRTVDGKAAFSSSKGKDTAAAPHGRPPLGPAVAPHQQAIKRKLFSDGKGKGKMSEGAAPIPAKRWVPTKGITIKEPTSREALSNSISAAPTWGNKFSFSPHRLAGPSRIGEWIEPNRGARSTDERVEIPHKGFERKSYSLELIRNQYQQDEEDEAKDDDKEEDEPLIKGTRSAPSAVRPALSDSPAFSVNQPIREASMEDIGWIRPIIGRWGDVTDSDEEDNYAEQSFGVEEEIDVPMNESGEEDAQEDGVE
ncbi:hypothetical protein LINPERHAP2_LOCUS11732, partial [Linum perenne]